MSEPKMTVTPRPADHTATVPAADRDYWKRRAADTEYNLGIVYRERAHLVAALAAHYPAVIADAPDVDEPGWKIVYLTLPTGQCSWHLAPSDLDLFAHVEAVDATDQRAHWDQHTTDEKYRRIRANTAQLAGGWDVHGDGKPF